MPARMLDPLEASGDCADTVGHLGRGLAALLQPAFAVTDMDDLPVGFQRPLLTLLSRKSSAASTSGSALSIS